MAPTSPTTSSNMDIFFIKQRQQLLLQRAAGDEIEDKQFAALADAVDAANALLDRHRIPGHVEIDQGVAELDVAPFAARLRAQKDARLVPKCGHRGVFLRPAETSVEPRERNAGRFEPAGEVGERFARMDEDELLLGRIAPDEVDERRLLAADLDRRPAVGKFSPNWIAGVAR